ncbi:unnamed protein product [Linum tenue]|uniref:Uncharacterized protein n=1 Tax=Linum tenue TaxID=586396 RepID=A0AAV0IIW6_9ROSI|nr:unnamed protein product [Linum tenue]
MFRERASHPSHGTSEEVAIHLASLIKLTVRLSLLSLYGG